ncbi:MAG: (2Fe-2S)-binding protein [Fimbriimonadaceae bacterium]|nr:(2Fe-2S)-binding protein [Fimbriimonadaceae bacterium]
MATHNVTVEGFGTFEVEEGKKLLLAIEQNGIDISHRCGGQARCTTCRVKFHSDEPAFEAAEHDSLEEDGVLGEFRLSCQIRVDRNMNVEVLQRASEMGWEPGPEVDE